jgi:hypothetical protein
MNLTDEERIRCNECLEKLYQTKLFCMQSIQYLLEQQREIDECITDLKSTKNHAQEINKSISELNRNSWLKLCCSNLNDQNQLLILPFPNEQSTVNNGLKELEKDLHVEKLVNSMKNVHSEFFTKDDFEKILHDEYTILFELAKKLTKCIQILHDTIEFLGTDIKLTLDHMQSAQPRMRQLLQIKVPLAFAQAQKDSLI